MNACGVTQNIPKDAAGGDGGPGIIQFHVSNLNIDIIPPGGTIEQNIGQAVMPPPLGYDPVSGRWEHQLLPDFGRISNSQSLWVPLGGVAIEAGTPDLEDFTFAFAGTDEDGEIIRTNETVDSLPAILTTSNSLENPDGATGLPTIDPKTLFALAYLTKTRRILEQSSYARKIRNILEKFPDTFGTRMDAEGSRRRGCRGSGLGFDGSHPLVS